MAGRSREFHYDDEPRRGPIRWIFWTLFRAPGKAILWLEFMYPKRGQVYASGRRFGNPIVEVITSIGFWLTTAYVLLLVTHPRVNTASDTYELSLPSRQNTARQHALAQSAVDATLRSQSQESQKSENTYPTQEANTGVAAPEQLVVATDFAKLRLAPTMTAPVVERIEIGERMAIIATQGHWMQIRRNDGKLGWIHRSLVQPVE